MTLDLSWRMLLVLFCIKNQISSRFMHLKFIYPLLHLLFFKTLFFYFSFQNVVFLNHLFDLIFEIINLIFTSLMFHIDMGPLNLTISCVVIVWWDARGYLRWINVVSRCANRVRNWIIIIWASFKSRTWHYRWVICMNVWIWNSVCGKCFLIA